MSSRPTAIAAALLLCVIFGLTGCQATSTTAGQHTSGQHTGGHHHKRGTAVHNRPAKSKPKAVPSRHPQSSAPASKAPLMSQHQGVAATSHSCTRTSSGSCIQGGEFCPQDSYGEGGYDANGTRYTCTGDHSHPHWE